MKARTNRKALSLGQKPSFSWQVQEDAAPLVKLVEPAPRKPLSRQQWTMLSMKVLLALFFAFWAGQGLLRRAESNLAEVEAEVAYAMMQEDPHTRPARTTDAPATLPQSASAFGEGITLLELQGNLALVDVIVHDPTELWYSAPYRVARTMRHEAGSWQTVLPGTTFWQERRTLETAYFVLEYSPRDGAAVREVAASLDEYYRMLHDTLGLTIPKRQPRISIRITVVPGSEARATDVRYSGSTLIVSPPALIPRPPEMSEAETLRQAIAYPLAVKVFESAQEEFDIPCRWRAVGQGVGLWLRWEEHTLPSRRLWLHEQLVADGYSGGALPRLDDLISLPRDCWQPAPFLETDVFNFGRPLPRPELAATLLEYITMTHGRSAVAALVENLQKSEDWDSLAYATVQISAGELEAAWHDHLRLRNP